MRFYPRPAPSRYGPEPLFLHDITFTFAVFGIWLTGAGLFYIAVWDQRRRCRSCLRRLVMPIATGSWGHMLTFGRPAHGVDLPVWPRHTQNFKSADNRQ